LVTKLFFAKYWKYDGFNKKQNFLPLTNVIGGNALAVFMYGKPLKLYMKEHFVLLIKEKLGALIKIKNYKLFLLLFI